MLRVQLETDKKLTPPANANRSNFMRWKDVHLVVQGETLFHSICNVRKSRIATHHWLSQNFAGLRSSAIVFQKAFLNTIVYP